MKKIFLNVKLLWSSNDEIQLRLFEYEVKYIKYLRCYNWLQIQGNIVIGSLLGFQTNLNFNQQKINFVCIIYSAKVATSDNFERKK